jgi:hypothetical protein
MVWIKSINKGTHLITCSDPAEDKSDCGANFDVNIIFSIHKYARLATSRGASRAEKDTLGIVLSSGGFGSGH